MTITDVMRHVKMRLGLSRIGLPVPDSEILENIYDESLRTFSAYFPYNISYEVKQSDKVRGQQSSYYIDILQYGDNIDIMHVDEIQPLNGANFFSGGNVYGAQYGALFPSFSYPHLADAQLQDNFSSMLAMPILFTFERPNKITFDMDMARYNSFLVKLGITHPRSFKTIKAGMVDDFYKMCRIDTKILLYPLLKHNDKFETTFGQIDLKIDEWSGAEGEREELIKEWKDKYLAARKRKIYNV